MNKFNLNGHFLHHGRPILYIASMSAVGILASFAFQIITARMLGPAEFGTLAAIFAYINIAATGSSSLQSSVAVQTAAAHDPGNRKNANQPNPFIDGPMIEAVILGSIGSLIVLLIGQLAPGSIMKQPFIALITCSSIILSFILAKSIGGIQGTGRSVNAVGWTTLSLLFRLLLVVICVVFNLGLVGVLWAVLIGSLISTIGATKFAQTIDKVHISKVFSRDSLVVLGVTLIFAVATNADVILVRTKTIEDIAGTYAAATVLIKSSFMVPATLSVYLLPRFAKLKQDASLTKVATKFTLILALSVSVLMLVLFGLLGTQITGILYGSKYDFSNGLLVWLTLAYLPWTLAQVVLIELTAKASMSGLFLLLTFTIVEVTAAVWVLPNISQMLWVIGILGFIVFLTFSLLTRRLNQPTFVSNKGK